ncbi:MAG: hydantoinase B/oxoprolinase family protein [Alicyclobacillus sp.]|nr:hydantoinase B/oxoprolinase family protein [Alicyclobacillus sp.]
MAVVPNALHTGEYDPVTAEVIQMRLRSIVDEMATILMHTSGSPVLTEAQDFCTAIFDDQNEHIAFSGYVITHIGSSLVGVRSIEAYYPRDEVCPGDHFILNDPYTAGALHQGDVAVISPLFYRDELVGWAFSNAHVLDVGGMSPGGWAPVARDVYAEGLNFPPTRIVHRGELNYEIFNLIRNNVRLPEPVVNDIKSLIASNTVSQRRLTELLDKVGVEEFRRYCEINKRLSERMVRERIEAIPDGVYEAEDWIEYDGHGDPLLVRVSCRLTVEGSSLTFDFRGSDPQIDGFVNAPEGAMTGIVGAMILLGLAYDVPVNAGVLRPVRIERGERGTVVNPTVPAPVSCAHMEGSSKAGRALWEAFVNAVQLSRNPLVRGRAAALSVYSWPGNSWVGLDKSGQYTAFAVMDCGSGGLGAQSTGDGLDISAYEVMLNNTIPDVEINESLYPMLYLWRSIHRDSGGPGYYRGGQGIDLAWIPYETDRLSGTVENACAAVPSRGVLGGYPGGTNVYEVYRGIGAVEEMTAKGRILTLNDLAHCPEILPNHAADIQISNRDVFRQLTGGGGGYGDPLLRPAEKVCADVKHGFLSAAMARQAYGVILDDRLDVNVEATRQERDRRLFERMGRPVQGRPKEEPRFGIVPAPEGPEVVCAVCGHHFGSPRDWRESLVSRTSHLAARLSELGIRILPRPDLYLKEQFCPSCGVAVENRIVRGEA